MTRLTPVAIDFPRLDLQGHVIDVEPVMEHRTHRIEERVSGMTARHDKVRGQHIFGRARRPDVEIVHAFHTGL